MIRLADKQDIAVLARFRVDLETEDWKDGYVGKDEDLEKATYQYLEKHLNDDCYIWVWDEPDVGVVAVCTMLLFTHLPDCDDLISKRGFLCNIYTKPEYRKRGIQKQLIEKCLNYTKKLGVKKFTLNANPHNEKALALYKKFGFRFDPNTGEFKMDTM